jgi:hypothetical protein
MEAKPQSTQALIEALVESHVEAMFAALVHKHSEVRQIAEQAVDLAKESAQRAQRTEVECARFAGWLQEVLVPEGLAAPVNRVATGSAAPTSLVNGSSRSTSSATSLLRMNEVLEQKLVARAVNEAVSEARAESLTVINTEFNQWRTEVAHEVAHALADVAEHADRLKAIEERIQDIEDTFQQTQSLIVNGGTGEEPTGAPLPLQKFGSVPEDVQGNETKATPCSSLLEKEMEELDKVIVASRTSSPGTVTLRRLRTGRKNHRSAHRRDRPLVVQGPVQMMTVCGAATPVQPYQHILSPTHIYSPGVPGALRQTLPAMHLSLPCRVGDDAQPFQPEVRIDHFVVA